MTLTAQVASLIEVKMRAAHKAAQVAHEHVEALLDERVIGNGLRAQLQALAVRMDASEAIQSILRSAHEQYGSGAPEEVEEAEP